MSSTQQQMASTQGTKTDRETDRRTTTALMLGWLVSANRTATNRTVAGAKRNPVQPKPIQPPASPRSKVATVGADSFNLSRILYIIESRGQRDE